MIFLGCGSYCKDIYNCDEYGATQYLFDILGEGRLYSNIGGYGSYCWQSKLFHIA